MCVNFGIVSATWDLKNRVNIDLIWITVQGDVIFGLYYRLVKYVLLKHTLILSNYCLLNATRKPWLFCSLKNWFHKYYSRLPKSLYVLCCTYFRRYEGAECGTMQLLDITVLFAITSRCIYRHFYSPP